MSTAAAVGMAAAVATTSVAGHTGTTATAIAGRPPRPGRVATGQAEDGRSRLQWVSDAEDDYRCVQALLGLSEVTTGVITVLGRAPSSMAGARPGAAACPR